MVVSNNKNLFSVTDKYIALSAGKIYLAICFYLYSPNKSLWKDKCSRWHFKKISQTLLDIKTNKERLQKSACERYQNLSEEENQKQQQFSWEWYKNLHENGKQRLVEYRKNIKCRKIKCFIILLKMLGWWF